METFGACLCGSTSWDLILPTGNAAACMMLSVLLCDNVSGFYFEVLSLDITAPVMRIPLLSIVIIILTLSGLHGERVLQQLDFIIRHSFSERLSFTS